MERAAKFPYVIYTTADMDSIAKHCRDASCKSILRGTSKLPTSATNGRSDNRHDAVNHSCKSWHGSLSIIRQPPHYCRLEPVNIVYHFDTEFLANDLHIAPLPESLGTNDDCFSRYPCANTKLQQTDGRLSSGVEVDDDNVGLVLFIQLPFHLLAVRWEMNILTPRAIPVSPIWVIYGNRYIGERST